MSKIIFVVFLISLNIVFSTSEIKKSWKPKEYKSLPVDEPKDESPLEEKLDKSVNEVDISTEDLKDEFEQEEVTTETFEGEVKEETHPDGKKYNIGPGVDVFLDEPKELVKVNLDPKVLKDIFSGRAGKKHMISKILPLFILPFLIQSSFVPFMLTTLKLLLLKSIVVGKLAILLLIIAAFKNHKQQSSNMETPYYLDPAPNRRSEAAYAAISGGYKAEGRPTTWVN